MKKKRRRRMSWNPVEKEVVKLLLNSEYTLKEMYLLVKVMNVNLIE